MTKLFPVLALSIMLIIFAERRSEWTIENYQVRKYLYKEHLAFFLFALCLAVFAGLRIKGNDTGTYRVMYENTPASFNSITIGFHNLATAPGLQFICVCLKKIGASTQDYLMIMSLFPVFTYVWFIRKYTTHITLSLIFFITMGVYGFTLAAIKQTTAMAILAIATDRAIQKKYVAFIILVFLAELFHPYAFIYLVIPFLFFAPWTNKTWLLFTGAIIVTIFLSRVLVGVLDFTDRLGAEYSEDEFSQQGVNIFRVFVVWVPVILSFLLRDQFIDTNNRTYNLFINATMINAIIMFIGLFGTANYFARLANYFLIFQVISLPFIIQNFDDRNARFLMTTSVVMYSLYYIYGATIAQGGFDITYRFMTVLDFVRQI